MKAKILDHNGRFSFEIDGKEYSPLLFRSNRPEPRSIQLFHQAGVKLYGVFLTGMNCTLGVPYNLFGENWLGPKQYDFSAIDRQFQYMLDSAPDALFNVILHLDTRDWYLTQNPECSSSYYNLVEMAGYQKWRDDTKFYLQDVIAYVEEHYGDRVFSYSLACGTSMEWYTNSQGYGNPEAEIRYHPIKEQCFQNFTGSADPLPDWATLTQTSHGVFRDPLKDREALTYWHFHHEIIGDTICYFAHFCKELLHRQKLLGVFYGYLMELHGERLLHEGQLGYEAVWKCPDIDMIYAPSSYEELRAFSGTSGFLNTIDSVKLHGKLFYQEIDHTTFIAPRTLENGMLIPGQESKLQSEFESVQVLTREFLMCEAKGTAMWWFDFFGGHFYSPGLEAFVHKTVEIQKELWALPAVSVSQIAVFADVESSYYVSAFSSVCKDTVRNLRSSLNRMGTPYDLFSLSDFPLITHNRYKLFIFLNAFTLEDEQLALIRQRIAEGDAASLWIYAPGLITNRVLNDDNIREAIGIHVTPRLRPQDAIICNAQLSPNVAGIQYDFSDSVEPRYEINDSEARVLGTYPDGAAGLVQKGKTFYSAAGNIPAEVLREIARVSGVSIYSEGLSPIYVNSNMIAVHVQEPDVTIRLPSFYHIVEPYAHRDLGCSDTIHISQEVGNVKCYQLFPTI